MSSYFLIGLILMISNTPDVSPIKLHCKPRPGCNFNVCEQVPHELMLLDGFNMDEYLRRQKYNIVCDSKTSLKGQKGSRGRKGQKGDSGKDYSEEMTKLFDIIEDLIREQNKTNDQLVRLQKRVEILETVDPTNKKVTSTTQERVDFQGEENSEQLSSQCEHPKIKTTCAPKCLQTCYDPKPTCDRKECNEDVECVCPGNLVQVDSTNATCVRFQECPGLCPVSTKEKCFFWEMNNWIDFPQAKAKCAEYGGHPANIYSKSHYDAIVKYIRESEDEKNDLTVDLWLGMGYETRTNTINLFGGSSGQKYAQWKTDATWPLRTTDYRTWTHVALSIAVDNDPTKEGMFNRDPTEATSHGVICEI